MKYEPFATDYFRGNVSAIAREFGVTRAAVQAWKRENKIPDLRVPQIELWKITRSQAQAVPQ